MASPPDVAVADAEPFIADGRQVILGAPPSISWRRRAAALGVPSVVGLLLAVYLAAPDAAIRGSSSVGPSRPRSSLMMQEFSTQVGQTPLAPVRKTIFVIHSRNDADEDEDAAAMGDGFDIEGDEDEDVGFAEKAGGSCAGYGCGTFNAKHDCQCNDECHEFDSCCSDYKPLCGKVSLAGFRGGGAQAGAGKSGGLGSCANYGCGTFEALHTCQCNDECHAYDSCCEDYTSTCKAGASGGQAASGAAAAPGVAATRAAAPAAPVVGGAASSGSCATFGCTDGYEPSQGCQCNPSCAEHDSCCSDYKAVCPAQAAPAPAPPAPAPIPVLDSDEFDCNEGYETRQFSWTPTKQSWCCNEKNVGCSNQERVSAPPSRSPNRAALAGESLANGGSCADFGCGAYNKDQACQCSPTCGAYNNCCHDYKAQCASKAAAPAKAAARAPPAKAAAKRGGTSGRSSCRDIGCTAFDESYACQCNPQCKEHDTCCSDYDEECSLDEGFKATPQKQHIAVPQPVAKRKPEPVPTTSTTRRTTSTTTKDPDADLALR